VITVIDYHYYTVVPGQGSVLPSFETAAETIKL